MKCDSSTTCRIKSLIQEITCQAVKNVDHYTEIKQKSYLKTNTESYRTGVKFRGDEKTRVFSIHTEN